MSDTTATGPTLDPDFNRILDQRERIGIIEPFQYPDYVSLSMQADVIGQRFNDAWNADSFINRYSMTVRYCHPNKKYYVWNGLMWAPDDYREVERLCHDHLVDLLHDPITPTVPDLIKHLSGCFKESRITGMMFFMESNRTITVKKEDLDSDPDRVNVLNGVLNLKNVEWEKPNRDRFITRRMGVKYDPAAQCPLWIGHLNLILNNDQETIHSFQMIAGYALLSKNPEQLFFILYGGGENGKSVTLNVISHIIGEYAMSADPRTFMFRRSDDNSVRSDIARLYPAHMITAVETGEDARLNENLLKQITGHDRIVSRELYAKEQERHLEGNNNFAPRIPQPFLSYVCYQRITEGVKPTR